MDCHFEHHSIYIQHYFKRNYCSDYKYIYVYAEAQVMTTQHQCLTSTVKHFRLACHPGHQLHIVTAVRGYSKGAVPGSRNCPYSSPECTVTAQNVIDMCHRKQSCTMDAYVAIKTTLWRPDCVGHTVATNFIQVNYSCLPGRSITKTHTCQVHSDMCTILF